MFLEQQLGSLTASLSNLLLDPGGPRHGQRACHHGDLHLHGCRIPELRGEDLLLDADGDERGADVRSLDRRRPLRRRRILRPLRRHGHSSGESICLVARSQH